MRMLASWVYQFHMSLFFILSGAVLNIKPIGSLDGVIEKKFNRLIVPYFIVGILYMLPVKRIGDFYTNVTLIQAYQGFWNMQESGHLWYLPALFWCMIISVICIKIVKNDIYLFLAFASIIYFFHQKLPLDIFGLQLGMSYLIYFAIGYWFEYYRKNLVEYQEGRRVRGSIIKFIILTILIITDYYWKILSPFFIILVRCYWIYIISLVVTKKFYTKIESNYYISVLVKSSFTVYLLHDPLEYLVLKVSFSINLLASNIGVYIYLFLRTVGIYFVCVGLWMFYNRFRETIKSKI